MKYVTKQFHKLLQTNIIAIETTYNKSTLYHHIYVPSLYDKSYYEQMDYNYKSRGTQ